MSEPGTGVTCLTGASLVLPDRVAAATLVIEGGIIVEIATGPREVGGRDVLVDLSGRLVLPGFIDVHVHGVAGTDVLDERGAVRRVARELPRWGVTGFCPTAVACEPSVLTGFLDEVGALRREPAAESARVLGAHLESNFLNPDYRGAQPISCLRAVTDERSAGPSEGTGTPFSGRDVLAVIDARRPDLAILTLAPEIPGGAGLLRALVAAGVRVSVGHSAVDYEQATSAFADGARQVTHLFNRMTPLTSREPGLVGAALATGPVAVEIICDGHHVHPASMRVAIAAKGADKVMAITDGTAGAGLPPGSTARLGGRTITVGDVARLDDGTMAGSTLTMDRAFATLVGACGVDLVDAARMCSSTPARELGLVGRGVIATGAAADLTVLDRTLGVTQTWIGGRRVWDAAEGDRGPEQAA